MADKKITVNEKYQEVAYARRQSRDTLKGSNRVKICNTLYLPMPSAMLEIPNDQVASINQNSNSRFSTEMSVDYIPWWHTNPAYRAYLQRARFPDITAATFNGIIGLATKTEIKIELPTELEYLIDAVAVNGKDLQSFYSYCLGETISAGNVNILADYDDVSGEWYLTTFTAETQVDWDTENILGTETIESVTFLECARMEDQEFIEYRYGEDGNPEFVRYKKDIVDEQESLVYRGKPYFTIPIFPAGSKENSLDPQPLPLQGISDISISMYQIDADLRQAYFMTCNPTLFLFGVGEKDKPKVIGSSVVVGIQSPNGRAEYPSTDTSALETVKGYSDGLLAEAVIYGANFLQGGAKESAESKSLTKAGQGASLVGVVDNVGSAILSAIKFIARMKGMDDSEIVFKPSTEFAEVIYTSNDVTALVSSWMSGAIDHDTLLDNMRQGGYVPNDKTNEQIKAAILAAPPTITTDENDSEQKPNNEGEEK